MEKEEKQKLNWASVSIVLEGREIKTTPIEYIEKPLNPTLNPDYREDFISQLKCQGIELIYGFGDFPLAISFQDKQVEIKTDPEYVGEIIKTIHRDEWLKQ